MGITVLFVSIASMGGVGLILAAILAVADKKLAVEEDPLVKKSVEILPGANCGACGYAGCLAFATALAEGKAPIAGCKPGGAEVADALAKLHGLKQSPYLPV